MKCRKATIHSFAHSFNVVYFNWWTIATNIVFRRNALRFALRVRQCSFVRSTQNHSSNISKTVWPRTPNFIRTSTPKLSTAIPDMTSLSTSSRKTVNFTASDGFWRNFPRTVQARIMKFYMPIDDNGPTSLPEMASPPPSGRLKKMLLNIVFRKVRKTGQKCRKKLITRKWCEIRQR